MNSTLLQYLPLPPVRQALGRPRGPSSPNRGASSRTCGLRGGAALAAQGRAGSRNCTAGFHLHYTDALQKFCNCASSGNPVIYNCSNPSLRGRKFLFLLPHIPTVVSEPVLSRYRFGYVHMEICVVSDRSVT